MPLKMVEVKRGGRVAGFRVVDDRGRMAGSFMVGKTVAGKKIKSTEDARARARAYLQAVNLEKRRSEGKSSPPRPGKNK